MASYNKHSEKPTRAFKVRDPAKLLKTVLLLAAVGGLAVLIDTALARDIKSGVIDSQNAFRGDNQYGSIAAIGLTTLAIVIFLRLRAIWSGVKVDPENRTVEFPGGNIAADDFIDYFTPRFLFQYFLRRTIMLEEIREIYQETKRSTREVNGRVKVSRQYGLAINGSFGAAVIWFNNEGKCDQIFSAIRQLNNMGEPIFNT
jgi:hypothetical protein